MRRTVARDVGSVVVLLLMLPVLARPASARQSGDLSNLSIEELMRVQVEPVFGAVSRLQPSTEAPSSVTIITADDIQRFGYRSLADILRGVRGLYVTYDRNYSYVGARGFSRPGDYNTRILVLIDGHRVNDDVFDQAPIGPELGLDPTTFERVEIIRGPTSALYGTSAFFAVVNITTRSGQDLRGVTAGVEGGSLGAARAYAMAGRKTGRVDASFSANVESDRGNESLFYPEFADDSPSRGIASDLDRERVRGGTARVSVGNLTLTGAYGWRLKQVPTASFGTLFDDPRLETTDERAFADASYQRAISGTDLTLHAYADEYRYDGVYPYAPLVASGQTVIFNDYGHGLWFGGDLRATRSFGGHQTAAGGLEFRNNAEQDQGASYEDNRIPAWTTEVTTNVFAVYANDEVRIQKRLLLSAGGRYDAYSGYGRFSPRASFVFAATPNRSFKYLFGNAFRAPNTYELDYLTNGVRNTALRPETITTHELVWEEYVHGWLRTSVSGYWNDSKGLITLIADDQAALQYVNGGRVRADGLELEAEVKLAGGLQAVASYALQRASDVDTGDRLTNSPEHLGSLRLAGRGLTRQSSAAIELLLMSQRLTPAGGIAAGSAVANFTYLHPVTRTVEVSLSARNLFNMSYADPASEEHVQDTIPQDGRTVRVGIEFRK